MENKAGRANIPEFQTASPKGTNWLLAIAIDEYEYCAKLKNCVQDAKEVVQVLTERYHFEKVISLFNQDATSENINDTLNDLKEKIQKDVDNLVLYFSGHGETEGDDDNVIGYLVPFEARQGKQNGYIPHLQLRSKLHLIATRHTFVIIDACFSGSFFFNIRGKSDGNAQQPSRWGISSSSSREVALDGTPGDNSPFAKCLIEALQENADALGPHGLVANIEKKMKARGVSQKPTCLPFSDHKKYKDGQFFFHATQNEAQEWTTTQATDTAAAYHAFYQKHPDSPHAQEALWQYACKQNEVAAFQLYRKSYPRGRYAHDVVDKMDDATFAQCENVKDLQHYLRTFGSDANHAAEAHEKIDTLLSGIVWRTPAPPISSDSTPSAVTTTPTPRLSFEPEMMPVQGGTFKMGSDDYDDEKPVHDVTVRDFYIGKYPVTFAEYDAYCEATNIEKPSDEEWGRDRRPVINVSWDDATAYCKWLSEKTGKKYRLPTEVEWEYAARGGNKSEGYEYAGSNNLDEVGWYHKNAGGKTQLVGNTKKSNELGIYDMSGNVWEWVEDNWHENYKGAPQDGRAWTIGGDQGIRVVRGGSWDDLPVSRRAAFRYGYYPTSRNYICGFCLVRHL